ncbi:M28 family peptidase [Mucilaginibacter calamicampi]|uniref:M28 family peptidase n=1 Tax=Mucilaginibacter calamicampi TaxID=1302352 RepID=A0ABW2YXJ1_9SPHI
MKKTLIILAFAGLTTVACAQQNAAAVKYSKIVSAELARKHLTIIASDEFEGRETGKPGAAKAAKYIADEFKALGLKAPVNGSYFLDVEIVEPSFTVNALTINGKAYTIGTDFSATGSTGTKTVAATDIVFIGYGIGADTYDDLKNTDIAGKVVLYINTGEPVSNGIFKVTGTDKTSNWSTDRSRRIQFIQSKKPAVILAVNPAGAAVRRAAGARMTLKSNVITAPVYTITPAIANDLLKPAGKTIAQLKQEIDANGTPQTQTIKADFATTFAGVETPVKAVDVVGVLPGRDPKLKNEYLVVSAHYDHIGMLPEGTKGDRINNGADDDGSGTTAMLEIARAFSQAKKAGKGPRRSILFLGNVGEEKGLLGSEYYSEHPVVPMANTIADLNIDMIGRVGEEYIGKPDSANTVYVIGSSMLSSDLHKAGEKANNTYTKLNLDYKYDDPNDPNRFYYRSDHYNFAKHNVPIIFYFNGVHKDYHGLGDDVSKINFPLLAKRAQLVYFTAWELSNADKRPVVDSKSNR